MAICPTPVMSLCGVQSLESEQPTRDVVYAEQYYYDGRCRRCFEHRIQDAARPGDEVIVYQPYFVDYGNYVANYDGGLLSSRRTRKTSSLIPRKLLLLLRRRRKS